MRRFTGFAPGRWPPPVVLLVLAALAGTFRVGLRHYRRYQEIHWQKEAQAFLARDDYRNAALSARKAITLNPNNVPACRIMAGLADRANSPVALDWLRRIVQNEPTVENKLVLASAGLKYQQPPFPLTVQILHDLTPTATNSAGYQVVAGSLAMQTHHLAEAEAHYETAAKLEPTNGLFRMSIAILRLASTNQTEQVQSRAILEKMRSEDGIGPLALRVLVADRLAHKDAAAANIYSSQLLANPRATLADQLQHLEILRHLKSDEFRDRLQTVQQQVTTNAPDVAEVAAWMQANGLVAESLDWLTSLPNHLLDQRPVQMALVQGYLQNRQWTEMLNIASQANWGDLEYLRLALVFRAWSQLGSAGAGRHQLERGHGRRRRPPRGHDPIVATGGKLASPTKTGGGAPTDGSGVSRGQPSASGTGVVVFQQRQHSGLASTVCHLERAFSRHRRRQEQSGGHGAVVEN
jgi:tetratricopeptide (TPR) repeat protein